MLALSGILGLIVGGAMGQAAQTGAVAAAPSAAEQWTPLFNGRDLDGWYTFLQKHGRNQDPDRVITIEDGMIHFYKHAPDGSPVVMGYISTDKEYGDYHLRLQFRWGEKKFEPRYKMKRDAGVYYHLIGPDKVWPRALQFQIEQTNVGDLIALYGLHVDITIDPKTRSEKIPTFLPGEQGGVSYVLGSQGVAYSKHLAGDHEREGWNTAEIIARGDTVTHILNGRVMSKGTGVRLIDPEKPEALPRPITRGRIALELEAAELYLRKVEIRPLKVAPGAGL